MANVNIAHTLYRGNSETPVTITSEIFHNGSSLEGIINNLTQSGIVVVDKVSDFAFLSNIQTSRLYFIKEMKRFCFFKERPIEERYSFVTDGGNRGDEELEGLNVISYEDWSEGEFAKFREDLFNGSGLDNEWYYHLESDEEWKKCFTPVYEKTSYGIEDGPYYGNTEYPNQGDEFVVVRNMVFAYSNEHFYAYKYAPEHPTMSGWKEISKADLNTERSEIVYFSNLRLYLNYFEGISEQLLAAKPGCYFGTQRTAVNPHSIAVNITSSYDGKITLSPGSIFTFKLTTDVPQGCRIEIWVNDSRINFPYESYAIYYNDSTIPANTLHSGDTVVMQVWGDNDNSLRFCVLQINPATAINVCSWKKYDAITGDNAYPNFTSLVSGNTTAWQIDDATLVGNIEIDATKGNRIFDFRNLKDANDKPIPVNFVVNIAGFTSYETIIFFKGIDVYSISPTSPLAMSSLCFCGEEPDLDTEKEYVLSIQGNTFIFGELSRGVDAETEEE